MKREKLVPEFERKRRVPRAGFVPGHYSEQEVETWQVWCHDATGEKDNRRATVADLRAAGFVKRKPRG